MTILEKTLVQLLIEKLEEISEAQLGILNLAANHGMPYTGPTYINEIVALGMQAGVDVRKYDRDQHHPGHVSRHMFVLGVMVAVRLLDIDFDVQRLVDGMPGKPRYKDKPDNVASDQGQVNTLD